jgi:hypothetical protein
MNVARGQLLEQRELDDTRVVHENVDLAEGLQRRLHNGMGALFGRHAMRIGDSLATLLTDLPNDRIRASAYHPTPVRPDAEVIDDDFGAPSGEILSVRPTQAGIAACPGHNRHLTFKA